MFQITPNLTYDVSDQYGDGFGERTFGVSGGSGGNTGDAAAGVPRNTLSVSLDYLDTQVASDGTPAGTFGDQASLLVNRLRTIGVRFTVSTSGDLTWLLNFPAPPPRFRSADMLPPTSRDA